MELIVFVFLINGFNTLFEPTFEMLRGVPPRAMMRLLTPF